MSTATPARSRSRLRLLPSTKIAIGFVLLATGLYYGYQLYAGWAVDRLKFAPIKPGRITLLGIQTGAGYKIVVQNRLAVLQMTTEADQGFEAPRTDTNRDTADDDTKRRIPIRELVGALTGDEKQLSRFVTIINELRDQDMPNVRVEWTAADVRKALDGDAALKAMLEGDLGLDFDGNPLPKARMSALQNGIVILNPVKVRVSIEGKEQELTAMVDTPYRTAFSRAIDAELSEKKLLGSGDAYRGAVILKARELQEDPSKREKVGESLARAIEPRALARYATTAERVLKNAFVVLNDSFIEDASMTEGTDKEGKPMYVLHFDLNNEGRQRMWQFSRQHRGDQLLVIKDGIAIAAPVIQNEIPYRTIDVTQLQEEGLVADVVQLVKELRKESK